jgi:hypothetical protein
MSDEHQQIDHATAFDRDPRAAKSIDNDELERELTLAAARPGRRRFTRFIRLLLERSRRRGR